MEREREKRDVDKNPKLVRSTLRSVTSCRRGAVDPFKYLALNCQGKNSNQNQTTGMGSKFRKRSSIATKGNGSCLWRFINIFESSIARKLLAERKHERASHPGARCLNSNRSEAVFQRTQERNKKELDEYMVRTSRFTSVKELIDEEMSKDKSSKAPGCNLIGNHEKIEIFKDKLDARFNDLMLFARLISEKTKCRDAVEASNLVTSLAALMMEFDHISHQHEHNFAEHKIDLCTTFNNIGCKKHRSLDGSDSQLSHMNSVLQEALNVKADTLLGHKIADSIEGHGAIQHLEYMNAVEILASNKELLSKLGQDPNSFVFRLVQELKKLQAAEVSNVENCNCLEGRDHLGQNMGCSTQIERSTSSQIFLKQKLHFFLMKKDKFMGKYVSKSKSKSKEMSTTIGLAPCTTRTDIPCLSSQSKQSNEHEKDSERFFSHLSFREIKEEAKVHN
ncbi:hypothetical protein HPP92_005026 [Vanilla planifolia]|uniref:DUF3741 domain-containing protein n=1 Tax=Vanilla planifolia TaxID=51239 RepID=A0A835RT21_VANPL|nr:hypothetical protein HPP92_005026 [Vanilla planifolia]